MNPSDSFLRKQARTQRFTLGAPKEFRVAPDGSRVLFLRAESGTDPRNSLWSLDLASGAESKLVDAVELLPGEEQLPPDERARRERSRETSGGVVGYAVDDGFRLAAFSLSGKLFTVDIDGRYQTDEVIRRRPPSRIRQLPAIPDKPGRAALPSFASVHRYRQGFRCWRSAPTKERSPTKSVMSMIHSSTPVI